MKYFIRISAKGKSSIYFSKIPVQLQVHSVFVKYRESYYATSKSVKYTAYKQHLKSICFPSGPGICHHRFLLTRSYFKELN